MRFEFEPKVNYVLALITIVLGVVIDQITKYLAATYLIMGKPVEIIPNFLNLGLVRNTGAAFGIGANWDPTIRKIIFLGLPIVAIGIIAYFLYKNMKERKLAVISISLILSGAIGNIINRLLNVSVVDFIEVYYKSFHWPNFNFADTIICVGVGLFIIHSFKDSKRKQSEAKEAT